MRKATQAFSCNGDNSRGEGGDFVLEAKNKQIQMMMPPGLLTAETWLRICRSLDELCSVSFVIKNSISNLPNLLVIFLT